MFWLQHLGCWGQNTSRIQNKEVYATLYLHAALNLFRICGRGMNYGRLVTMNASVLTYEHVDNDNERVTDRWSIIKTRY